MKKIIGIYGAGGFGREVLPLVREQYFEHQICFIVDGQEEVELNGCPVYTYQNFLDLPNLEKFVIFAIGNSKARESLEVK